MNAKPAMQIWNKRSLHENQTIYKNLKSATIFSTFFLINDTNKIILTLYDQHMLMWYICVMWFYRINWNVQTLRPNCLYLYITPIQLLPRRHQYTGCEGYLRTFFVFFYIIVTKTSSIYRVRRVFEDMSFSFYCKPKSSIMLCF